MSTGLVHFFARSSKYGLRVRRSGDVKGGLRDIECYHRAAKQGTPSEAFERRYTENGMLMSDLRG